MRISAVAVVALAGLTAVDPPALAGECATVTSTVHVSRVPRTALERALYATVICLRRRSDDDRAEASKSLSDEKDRTLELQRMLDARTSTAVAAETRESIPDGPSPDSGPGWLAAGLLIALAAVGGAIGGALAARH